MKKQNKLKREKKRKQQSQKFRCCTMTRVTSCVHQQNHWEEVKETTNRKETKGEKLDYGKLRAKPGRLFRQANLLRI